MSEALKNLQPGEGERGMGGCVTEALEKAGFDQLELPGWVKIEDIPVICRETGLRWHGPGEVSIKKNQPVIAIYETKHGRGHAEYVKDLAGLKEKKVKFIGIIEL